VTTLDQNLEMLFECDGNHVGGRPVQTTVLMRGWIIRNCF
jgi:hypothetical protein